MSTPEERMATYHDLSVTELAKLINDEYAVILSNERTNYPRAISIGEKLVALRRGVSHGEWLAKLETLCPQVSYETATKYVRLAKKQVLIERAAAAKGVATTTLTIDSALKLVATAKKSEDTSKGKPISVVKGAIEPGNGDAPDFVEVGEAGIARDDAMRHQRCVQLVG